MKEKTEYIDPNGPKLTYKDSGVDVEKGELFVERIKAKVLSSYGPEVLSGVGGFCSLYRLGDDRLLAAGTDGVGTKLRMAQILQDHSTIGIDLVAMCANDVLCSGARPLFFLDYLSCGRLDLAISEQIIHGIVEGCKKSNMPLMGGETAEMPGFYPEGEYDLAGFCVGEVRKDDLLDGKKLKEGDILIGLASSGFHSNGYSLLRQLVKTEEKKILEALLAPTRIYVEVIQQIFQDLPGVIKGLAHITGGGIRNIPRMNPHLGYTLDQLPELEELPAIIGEMAHRSELSWKELYQTFNMGIGMVLAIDSRDEDILFNYLNGRGEKFWKIGLITGIKGDLKIRKEGKWVILN